MSNGFISEERDSYSYVSVSHYEADEICGSSSSAERAGPAEPTNNVKNNNVLHQLGLPATTHSRENPPAEEGPYVLQKGGEKKQFRSTHSTTFPSIMASQTIERGDDEQLYENNSPSTVASHTNGMHESMMNEIQGVVIETIDGARDKKPVPNKRNSRIPGSVLRLLLRKPAPNSNLETRAILQPKNHHNVKLQREAPGNILFDSDVRPSANDIALSTSSDRSEIIGRRISSSDGNRSSLNNMDAEENSFLSSREYKKPEVMNLAYSRKFEPQDSARSQNSCPLNGGIHFRSISQPDNLQKTKRSTKKVSTGFQQEETLIPKQGRFNGKAWQGLRPSAWNADPDQNKHLLFQSEEILPTSWLNALWLRKETIEPQDGKLGQ